MRTIAEIDAYVTKTTYGLFDKSNQYDPPWLRRYHRNYWKPSGMRDLFLMVDGQKITCEHAICISLQTEFATSGPSPNNVNTSILEITHDLSWFYTFNRGILPTSLQRSVLPYPLLLPTTENISVWWQDKPCITLTKSSAIGESLVAYYKPSGKFYLSATGDWYEFRDYVKHQRVCA